MTQTPKSFRSGFVSIIGRPNAGKSTLLNALMGDKLAIVSSKPQTTRTSVQGVQTTEGTQIIFLDTPGIHQSKTLLSQRMMDTVRAALEDRDVLLYLADSTVAFDDQDTEALQLLKNLATPTLLLLTKIDQLRDKQQLLPRLEQFKAVREFDEYIPIASVTGEGLERVRACILERLPEGPRYFPSDYLTDQPERFLAAELIREKILDETHQEVPHSIAVMVEKWEEKHNITRIAATIYVERPGQKAIVIGAKGAMLKKIGTAAREEMERMFGRKIFLELFVKVTPGWRESAEFVKSIDWRSSSGTE